MSKTALTGLRSFPNSGAIVREGGDLRQTQFDRGPTIEPFHHRTRFGHLPSFAIEFTRSFTSFRRPRAVTGACDVD